MSFTLAIKNPVPSSKCGAALKTAGQNSTSLLRVQSNWVGVTAAAYANGVSPGLLAAIGVRETGFQNIAQIGGGKGMGVFQIDLGANQNVTAAQASDFAFSSNFAAGMLASNLATLSSSFPSFTSSQLTQAAAASYNFGTSNISGNPSTIDQGSTNNNYGSNVVNLASCFN